MIFWKFRFQPFQLMDKNSEKTRAQKKSSKTVNLHFSNKIMLVAQISEKYLSRKQIAQDLNICCDAHVNVG